MVTPLFTSRGVCYTSQITEIAYSASEFYGVEIWVTTNRAGLEYPSNKKSPYINNEIIYFSTFSLLLLFRSFKQRIHQLQIAIQWYLLCLD